MQQLLVYNACNYLVFVQPAVSKEMPLDISNVAILNPETNKADRVGIKLIENEGKVKRVRFFKSNGSVIGA